MRKLVLFDVRILALALILAIGNALIYGRTESPEFAVLLGIVLFVMVWFFWLLINVLVIVSTRVNFVAGEKRQIVELANLIEKDKDRNQNGVLILTDQHLYFKTYFFQREKIFRDIPLQDIKKIALTDKGFIERYRMKIIMRSGADMLFSVYAGKRWQKLLQAQNVKVEMLDK